ncbi:MAG: twin-arginine translocation signal domain-containing protein [Alsobacter sp.]|jgi:hypothetical protein
MTDRDGAKALHRRQFLTLGATGAAAAAATLPLAAVPAEAASWKDDKRKARYRESEHVKAFYRVNRY